MRAQQQFMNARGHGGPEGRGAPQGRGGGHGRAYGGAGQETHTNTRKTFENLKYCPNPGCGYDVDHEGRDCMYAPPMGRRTRQRTRS